VIDKDNHVIYLCGYTQFGHTNWYPWKKFFEVFEHLGYEVYWASKQDIRRHENKKNVYITWCDPDTIELLNDGIYQDGDIIFHKLVAFGQYDSGIEWGDTMEECLEFFKNFRWTLYKVLEDAYDAGINIWGFGAKTEHIGFGEKERIVEKMKDRIFWIPWGSSLCTHDEVFNSKPITSGFTHDIGFVGSIWGTKGRGNIMSVQDYLSPLLEDSKYTHDLGGAGTTRGQVNDDVHKEILKRSRVCPIVNAPSFKVEKGVMDRFWTIHTLGRFGIADTEGVYEFFNEDEVEYAATAEEWREKMRYYIKNTDKQIPFIQKIQKRIREEYNYYHTWKNILNSAG